MKHSTQTAGLTTLLLLATLLAPTGCRSLEFAKLAELKPWELKEDESRRPVRMVAIWTDAVNYPPDQRPVRGYGGRIYFYDSQGRTVTGAGELIVYAFDDQRRDQSTRLPDRKFAFTAEQFAEHYSASEIGDSYSVWLPWDEAGGAQREISLIPIFRPTQGDVVVGEQTRHILRGATPEPVAPVRQASFATDRPAAAMPGVQSAWQSEPATQAQLNQLAPSPQMPSPRMQTTTIPVPSTLARQIAPTVRAEAINQYAQRFRQRRIASRRNNVPQPTAAADLPAARTPQEDVTGPTDQSMGFQPPPPTRFVRARHRVLGEPIALRGRDRSAWQPGPVAPPSNSPASR